MANEDPNKGKWGEGQDGKITPPQGGNPEGAAGGGKGESGEGGANAGKAVSYESFQEVLKEKKAMQKKLADFEAKAKADSDKKMEEEGKVKELYEGEKSAKAKALDRLKLAELKLVAFKAGVIDPDYLKILVDQVEFDADGIPQNTDAFFASLKQNKPFLFGQAQAAPGHANAGGTPWKPGATFTEKQIAEMSPDEFLKNYPEIQKQMKDGKIT